MMVTKPDAIVILSHTRGGNDYVKDQLDSYRAAHAGSAYRQVVIQAVVEMAPRVELEALAHEHTLCAVVLVIEPTGHHTPCYSKWVEWCAAQVARQDDFRLFVALYHVRIRTPDDLRMILSEPCTNLLKDTVQLALDDDFRPSLVEFLEKLEDIRDTARKRRLWNTLLVQAGQGAALGQSIVSAALVMAAISVVWRPTAFAELSSNMLLREFLALGMGIVTFPLMLYATALLVKPDMLHLRLDKAQPVPWLVLIVASFLVVAILVVWTETQNQYAWGVAGVTAGYLLDVTRRHGNRAHRCFRTLDPTTIAHRRETLSQPLKEALDGTSPFVMSAPILSDASARVFISYPHARASDRSWADPWAYEIYRTLTDAEIQCFWDQRSITPGMSWRTALNQAMADANVVIVLLGSEILDRPWCAAELEAALQNARSVGVPDIFVLKQPGAEAHLSSGLPVFEALMAREPSSTYPKISPLLDDTPKSDDKHAPSHRKSHTVTMLVNNLKTYRFNQTYAILPPSVTNIIFYLLVVPKLVFFMVGSWSTIVAWVALALSILELSTIVNIESTLTSLGLFPFVFLLCGFYAGFMGRLVAASAFDIHIPQKIHVLKVHLLMWVGYLALFSIWSLAAELLTTVWGILVGGLGWLMGNSFVFHVSSPVHDLRRSG